MTTRTNKNPRSTIDFSDSKKKPTRRLNLIETYSKLYYKTRVRPTVIEDLALFGKNPSRSVRLETIRRVTAQKYHDEDDDIRAVVAEKAAADARAADTAEEDEDEDDGSRTPEQYQA